VLRRLVAHGEEVGDGVVGHRLQDDGRLGFSREDGLVLLVNVVGEFQLAERLLPFCGKILFSIPLMVYLHNQTRVARFFLVQQTKMGENTSKW
jgi:hypothetical protein